ncbi:MULTISPECIES: DUF523 domain-containing protein [Serratia]|uniref:Uncharacterized conserved protein n=1 Tax=Serratia quinivorans TaxID=137545 RepID=A0A379YNY5_9GAMM|nr:MULTISPECIES: DUF523 domain-containing protein [Serratia]RYM61547.1 purine-nucleoside phosphorylase [Serratia proteamaculans]CAI0852623.1 Uncharacterized conserved protein [Serratia quinivorans]CAI1692629.1 Uncharacterized conserved protein [Serratia quinivorans]CAI1785733.1 Uncharacterized conserved protein [Serratia quinivorans]SUI47555.1 Uncharacterized conserved protein [Serratia quinivorans]
MPSKILFSACLAGFKVRYNASDKPLLNATLLRWQREGRLVVCCPELAAGFSTPRPSAEITPAAEGATVLAQRARVIEVSGSDVTAGYLLGAHLALETAQRHDCRFALLTDGSPSCGSQFIYDGSFSGQTKPGSGVTAELLRQNGIEVFSDRQIDALIARIEAVEQT